MTELRRCPKCNAELPSGQDPEQGCPSCVMGLALDAASGPIPAGGEVGPYRIVRELGQGGMGTVYLAEQSEPIRRQVALKVIRHGMDTRAVVARFEAERQALARMDHPAIARVFEAGETEAGRPYFVMEFIEGEPIHEYCDRRQLTTAERLELFAGVCRGLQHAHQRGIIHRDIKPTNILVTEQDGKPQPKIIDFGVAKAIEQPLTDQSKLTALGVLLGTPEYMSPEQADVGPVDVDTRSDVYSLGVVLYELLTGALPLDVQEMKAAAFDEIRRQIREVRPSRPSARLSELGERAAGLARSRGTAVATLARRLSGELDLITMKALEKERELRYGSPAELADDIGRHLAGEPVLARPPSAWYLLRKLIAKHRLTAALISVVVLTLIGAGTWLVILYGQSQDNLRRAVAAEQEAAEEAAVAREVSEFLIGVFEVSDPGEARGNSATARELLDQAAERIDGELDSQPEIQATLMNTMGRVYGSLGLYERSESLMRETLERRRELHGEQSIEVAESTRGLAGAVMAMGRLDEAEEHARRAIEIHETLSDTDSLGMAEALERLMLILWFRGEQDDALDLALRVLEIRETRLGSDDLQVHRTMNNIGNIYLAMGRFDEAESLFLKSLERREAVLGPDHPDVASVLSNLAETLRRQGRYEEAVPIFLRVQRIDELSYELDHPSRAFAFNNLGLVYKRMKRYDEAVEQLRRAVEIREAALPGDHPLLAWTLDNLGGALRVKGDLVEAEQAIERALAIAHEAVGPENPSTLIVMTNLAMVRVDQERFAEGEEIFRRVLELNRKVRGPDHPEIGSSLHNLANSIAKQGRTEEAIELFREAVEHSVRTLGADHPDTVQTRGELEKLTDQRSAESR